MSSRVKGGLYLSEREKRRKEANTFLIVGWSKRYGRKVTIGEVEEIKTNVCEFMDVMQRIEQYLKQREADKNAPTGADSALLSIYILTHPRGG